MLRLASLVTELPGIGPAKAQVLKKLGIHYVRDLLFLFPRRYEDFSNIVPIASLKVGEQMTVKARVKSAKSSYGFWGRRRLLRVFAEIEDDTGTLQVTWFNLRFLIPQLTEGREIAVSGTVDIYGGPKQSITYAMRSPAFEFLDKDEESRTHTASIVPIYPETTGVTSRFLRYQIKRVLPLIEAIPEYIPKDIIKREKLIDIHDAIHQVHFPESTDKLEEAKHRLRFDELFFLQLAALVRRRKIKLADAHPVPFTPAVKEFILSLPFELTNAQQEAIAELQKDLKEPHPMNRLLQGDVGSGKSAVALICAFAALENGYKVLYLAPTEILARQQALSFGKQLPYPVELLIGSISGSEKIRIKKKLQHKQPVCIIGTHALLQEDVSGENIGLVIIDEQHRFGVEQRKALRRVEAGFEPHLLSMTATPIPRTLSLTVYGDLDVSTLNELPPGRKPVTTKIIAPDKREEAIIHTLQELHAGRQTYVIASLVEESDKVEAKSATKAYEEVQGLFPGISIGLVHGQMKSQEKEQAMADFASGKIQLLVSTAVVEVGVNVPNATIMIIEGAERFGLAQLHQFRGRIGRGEHPSTCYLFPTNEKAARSKRLHVIAASTDGFEIAEKDLELRGPGEVYGVEQSGFSNLQVASLLDYPAIKSAREEAQQILDKDPDLTALEHDIIRRKVEQKNMATHFE